MKIESIVDAVSSVWSDRVTPYEVTCAVVGVAHELGYPQPMDTGVWANDVPGLLSIVTRRLRHEGH